jgi:hypothetical protein
VGCIYYGCSKDVWFRIPAYARQNSGSDGKMVVIDPTTNTELDLGRASYDPATDSWTSGSRYTTASDGWGAMCGLHQHCDGVLMSGIVQFGGLVRPEEIAQGTIRHALALVVPYWRLGKYACPAVKSGGGTNDPYALPEGARLQLDPTLNVSAQTWPRWQKVIARALQRYGGYVVDAGSGSFEVRAEANLARGYDAWRRAGVNADFSGSAKLTNLPWSRMRVLKLEWC